MTQPLTECELLENMLLENANVCGLIFKGLEAESWRYLRDDSLMDIAGNLALFGGGKMLKQLKALKKKLTPKWIEKFADKKVKKLQRKLLAVTGTDKVIRQYKLLQRVTQQGFIYKSIQKWIKKQTKKVKLPVLPTVRIGNQIRRLKNLLTERYWRNQLNRQIKRYSRRVPTVDGVLKKFLNFWLKDFKILKSRTTKEIIKFLKYALKETTRGGNNKGFIYIEYPNLPKVKQPKFVKELVDILSKPKPRVSPKPKSKPPGPGQPNIVPFRRGRPSAPKAPRRGTPLVDPSRNPTPNPPKPDPVNPPKPKPSDPADRYRPKNPTDPAKPTPDPPSPPKPKPEPPDRTDPHSDPERITPPQPRPPSPTPPPPPSPIPPITPSPPPPSPSPPSNFVDWIKPPTPVIDPPRPIYDSQTSNNQNEDVSHCKCTEPKRKTYQKYMLQYCECDKGSPKIKTANISAETGSISQSLIDKFAESAELAAIGCRRGAVELVLPETYNLRTSKEIPQLKVIYRAVVMESGNPKRDDNGNLIWAKNRRVIHIPHFKGDQNSSIDLEPYTTGQVYGKAVLKDGSHIYLYGKDQETVVTLLENMISYVDPDKVPDDDTEIVWKSYGTCKGNKLSEYMVYPYRIEYYDGRTKGLPYAWYRDIDDG